MNLEQFVYALFKKNVKMYVIQRARSFANFGMNFLHCSTVNKVAENLQAVYKESEKQGKWNDKNRGDYIKAFKQSIASVGILENKSPKNTQLDNSSFKKKRKLIVDSDTEEDDASIMSSHKKIMLTAPVPKPIPTKFFELSVHDTVWKLCFKKEAEELLINHNTSMKVKFNINDKEKIMHYVVRITEMMLREACKIEPDVKCKLTYGTDLMYECRITQATRNIRDASKYVWNEMVAPFYETTMM